MELSRSRQSRMVTTLSVYGGLSTTGMSSRCDSARMISLKRDYNWKKAPRVGDLGRCQLGELTSGRLCKRGQRGDDRGACAHNTRPGNTLQPLPLAQRKNRPDRQLLHHWPCPGRVSCVCKLSGITQKRFPQVGRTTRHAFRTCPQDCTTRDGEAPSRVELINDHPGLCDFGQIFGGIIGSTGRLRPLSFGPTSPRTSCSQLLGPITTGDSLAFDAFVSSAGCEVLVFFCPAAGPLNHHAIDLVLLANSECYREFGLGEITRSAFDQTRLN